MAEPTPTPGGDFDDFISAFDAGFKKLTTGDNNIAGRELAVDTPKPLMADPTPAPGTIYVRYGYVGPQDDAGAIQPYQQPGQLAPVSDDPAPLAPTHNAKSSHFSPPVDGSIMTRHTANLQEGILFALNNRALSMSGKKALSEAQRQFIVRYAHELDKYMHVRMGAEAGAMLSRFRSQLEHEQYRLDAQLRQERQDLRDATLERIAKTHDRNSRKINDPDVRAAYEEMKRHRIQRLVEEEIRENGDVKGR